MKHHRLLYGASIAAMLVWTAIIGGVLVWDWRIAHEHAEEMAKKEARIHFNKDLAFRRWATRHGGVYVPIDERTPPNPGLAHLPERDIATPSGRKLTLMNPAYIMRQAMGEYAAQFGVQGKLTSLKLINPNNASDAWETAALHRFEQGVQEVSEFTELDGRPVLRLMGILKVEQGCLKCHGFQGHKVGDVRGGVGVIVPMKDYLDDASARVRENLLPLGAIWLLGGATLTLLFFQVRARLLEQYRAEAELHRKNLAISRANADLTRFAEVSAHHLMEPTRRLTSYAQRLRASLLGQALSDEDGEVQNSLDTLEHDAGHLRALVRDIQLYLAAGEPRGEVCMEDANVALMAVEQRLSQLIATRGAKLDVQPLPPANLDRQRLTDLFAVLVENALRHGRPADPQATPCIRIRGERDHAVSRYSVSDNGPGIPNQYLERVFGIFERLGAGNADSDAGTGIGLSIARRIIESRHGRIWIENLPQGGAMVVFELPDGETQ
ncbi:MAG: ATP-binding protein [Sterolibacterium sp.]